MDDLKAWVYAQTTFGSEQIQISYPKAEISNPQNMFLRFGDHAFICTTYVLLVCIICILCIACIICII